MKCAKCGHEVDPTSPNCPYCAASDRRKTTGAAHCPKCGSDHIEDEPAPFPLHSVGGLGCLWSILELLGWLWLAVFGIHPKDHVCLDCGYRWSGAFRIWFSLLVLALGAALLTGILFACLPLLLVAAAVLALIGVVVGSFMLFRMLKD